MLEVGNNFETKVCDKGYEKCRRILRLKCIIKGGRNVEKFFELKYVIKD